MSEQYDDSNIDEWTDFEYELQRQINMVNDPYQITMDIANAEAQEYFDMLDECQEQYNKNWNGCTHEDMHLTDPYGWL